MGSIRLLDESGRLSIEDTNLLIRIATTFDGGTAIMLPLEIRTCSIR